MKTVLDIPKQDFVSTEIYDVNNINELYDAIIHLLNHHNPTAQTIQLKNRKILNANEIISKCGFEYNIVGDNSIRFKGYSRWVYFLDGVPVWFDSAGSQTDSPSHTGVFVDKIYKTLKYDTFKKIRF